mgnify:CR=1 FL=1
METENLITAAGNCSPFVYRDDVGIHIGDCDNHETFACHGDAIAYARKARLSGAALAAASDAIANDPHGNAAAEYRWHEDAGLQIDALEHMDIDI